FSSGKVRPNHETNINIIARRTGKDVNSHTVLDGIITTIMATIQRINIIGSREGSRNRRRLVLNLPFKALMFLTLMRPSLGLFLVLWLKLVKDFLKVRCRLALLPFLISCLIWLDLVASLPLIKERILVIILLLHFL